MMNCWKCLHPYPDPPFGKLPFRSECQKCHADLHCCCNCAYYKPGLPNDCQVPGTEFVSDRTRQNLCEEFKIKNVDQTLAKDPKTDPKEVLRRLFGDDL